MCEEADGGLSTCFLLVWEGEIEIVFSSRNIMLLGLIKGEVMRLCSYEAVDIAVEVTLKIRSWSWLDDDELSAQRFLLMMRLRTYFGDILQGETIRYQDPQVRSPNLFLDWNVSMELWLQDSVAWICIPFLLEDHKLQSLDQSLKA